MILVAYAGNQFGRLRTAGLAYSLANAIGAAVLSVVAAAERQWGFLLLESVWTLVSLVALARLAGSSEKERARRAPSPP